MQVYSAERLLLFNRVEVPQRDILVKTVQCELSDYPFDHNLQLLIEYVYHFIKCVSYTTRIF